nr:hypothetical protein GCM10020093_102340 [Planobispora longispora]
MQVDVVGEHPQLSLVGQAEGALETRGQQAGVADPAQHRDAARGQHGVDRVGEAGVDEPGAGAAEASAAPARTAASAWKGRVSPKPPRRSREVQAEGERSDSQGDWLEAASSTPAGAAVARASGRASGRGTGAGRKVTPEPAIAALAMPMWHNAAILAGSRPITVIRTGGPVTARA